MTKKEELNRLFGVYDIRLEKLYDKFIDRLVHLGYNLDELTEDVLFNFDNFPELTEELNKVFNDYVQEQMLCYKAGITDGVALAYSQNKGLLKGFSVLGDKALTNVRNNAANAFIRNRLKSPRGLSLSQLVWNYSQQSKSEFEVAISDVIADGLKSGTSAEELGRRVREYLNHPDMMYRRYHEKVVVNGQKKDVVTWRRRVIDENGKVRFVKAPLEEVGMGHYRSSRKNAVRLMRTEINSSYHLANYEFWQNEPYIIGIRISLSPQHPHEDICDDLAGDYPKDFKWSGWHPQCYSEDTKVLTQRGWRYLHDVLDNDKIMSLNPQTKEIEWTNIVDRQEYTKKGDMIRFYNRSLDCLVTPEHRMVYLSKSHGKIEYCEAKDYKQSKGAFYRGCKYFADDTSTVFDAGKISIDFDKFCAFMGYWLSDGSVANDNRVIISQRDGEKSKPIIEDLLKSIGFNVFSFYDGLYFYNKKLVSYLKQFGKCTDKYIPDEIKNSSPRQINIFLNAFILCDGYIKKPKTFIGNRGTICVPKHEERLFYTTSERMAGDLCELLLKIGHRPSIKDIQPTTSIKKDGTVIKSNHVCYIISDCKATTATVFNKETQYYSGKVYDLTLEKNHIMYMQRNGRCFWGSNCLCTSDPITIKGKEKEEFYRRLSEGEDMSGYVSPNRVKDVPKRYRAYTREHHDEIFRAAKRGKLAWHYLDNTKYWANQFTPAELKQMGIAQAKKGVKEGSKLGRKDKNKAHNAYQNEENNLPPVLSEEQLHNINDLANILGVTVTLSGFSEVKRHANRYRYVSNCQSCVIAHEAGLRGLDVTAVEYIEKKGHATFELGTNTEIAWINPKNGRKPELTIISGKDIEQKVAKQTKGVGRYHIGVNYNDKYGHIITCERLKNGELSLYDPYNDETPNLRDFLLGVVSAEILKVDKLLFNNDIVSQVITPYKKGR